MAAAVLSGPVGSGNSSYALIKGARDDDDIRMLAVLVRCRYCGSQALDDRGTIEPMGGSRSFHTTCLSCDRPATLEFELATSGSLEHRRPGEIVEAFQRLSSRIGASREAHGRARVTLALRCLDQLAHVVSPEDAEKNVRLRRRFLRAEYARMKQLEASGWPPAAVDLEPSPVLANEVLAGKIDQFLDVTQTRIVDSDFTAADLSYSKFSGATAERCTFAHATLASANLSGARIIGGDWTAVDLRRARCLQLRATDVRFDAARFGRAWLDASCFERCTFRGASFAAARLTEGRTSENATFVECDLSNTDWTERHLRKTRFLRCNLAGAHGKSATVDGLELEDCDIDLPAFLAQLGWNLATRRWWIEGEFSSSDFRMSKQIGIEIESAQEPTQAEARAALEPIATQVVIELGGSPEWTDRTVSQITISPSRRND